MSGHLKRLAAPKRWNMNRKGSTFIAKPHPGPHAQHLALPLVMVVRDMLHYAATAAETKKLLHHQELFVDGLRRHDIHFPVGLFDVISWKEINTYYRLVLDTKGRICCRKITVEEAGIKPCQILGKKILPGGKVQYQFHDGKTIISARQARVGDSMVLALPSLEVKEVLPLKKGAAVFLTQGKHSGEIGIVQEIKGKEATFSLHQKEIGTVKKYLFVVGDTKPVITLT